jgi:type II restriction enzyme
MINDGAYSTMVERITSNTNPDFFFMNYDKNTYEIKNFFVIPKYFFTPNIIIKRKPLSQNARRAGWVGCNIDLRGIPQEGRIFIVKEGKEISKENVVENIQKNLFLSGEEISSRGWLLDIMRCIEDIKKPEFSLSEIYNYEKFLQELHPNNNNIKAKIRQQLQILRDKGYLEFLEKGKYARRSYEKI